MKEDQGQDNRYRGRDLMNTQKELLFQKLLEYIKEEKGELAFFLDRKEHNSQEYEKYSKQIEQYPDSIKLTKRREKIERTQYDILVILQPLFDQAFDNIKENVAPGGEYNEVLRFHLRFDLIFGKENIPFADHGDRDHYRLHSAFFSSKDSSEKTSSLKTKEKHIWLPLNHTLITLENYQEKAKKLSISMDVLIDQYIQKFSLDSTDKNTRKKTLETCFLYIFIRALIQEKMVFNVNSTKKDICLDGVINNILSYFQQFYGENLTISAKDIKKRFWFNLHNKDNLLELSYENVILSDVEYWEEYINSTYFVPKNISINDIRSAIMQEFGNQKGNKEKGEMFWNSKYYDYQDQVNKQKKHLLILKEYQHNHDDNSSQITSIISDVQQKLQYAQQKQKEYTIGQRLSKKITPVYDRSLTEITNAYMKHYQVPMQYRHIFGIIINKINHFYQAKIKLNQKADKYNQKIFTNIQNFYQGNNAIQENKNIMDCIHNYVTFKDIDMIFEKKWSKKRKEKQQKIVNIIQKSGNLGTEYIVSKNNKFSSEQLSLEL